MDEERKPGFPWWILGVVGMLMSLTAALVNQRIAQQTLENNLRIQQMNQRILEQQRMRPHR